MTVASLARNTPTSAPSMAGEGVTLPLAGGQSRQVRFSSRAIIKIENTWGSHLDFVEEFERIPMNTLGWVLLHCCADVENEDAAVELLDGCDWRELRRLVYEAWDQANLPRPPAGEADPT